jgi:DNA-binding transcriptional LysR family regulator
VELRQIRYFITVAEVGNLTHAAEQLFITQPALTRQIQALERELGVSLFERKNRRLALTYAGEYFLSRTRPWVEQLSETNLMMQELSHGATGILRVAAASIPMYTVVLPAAAKFRVRWPRFHIQLSEEPFGSAVSLVERGDVDLSVGVRLGGSERLHSEVLYKSRLYALVSPDHHLAGRTYLMVEELARENLFLTRASGATQLSREFMLHIHGLHTPAITECDLTESKFRAAELGFGVATSTDSVSYQGFALEAIPLLDGDRQVDFQVAVTWDSRQTLAETTKEFIESLRESGAQRQTVGYAPWAGADSEGEVTLSALGSASSSDG